MLNPPLTAVDLDGLFETTNGERVRIIRGPDSTGNFAAGIIGGGTFTTNASGKTMGITLARRLPISDPVTELERRVVDAAVAMNARLSGCDYVAAEDLLYNAVDALIAARRPRPRRVDNPEALRDILAARGWGITSASMISNELFNALPEVGE